MWDKYYHKIINLIKLQNLFTRLITKMLLQKIKIMEIVDS